MKGNLALVCLSHYWGGMEIDTLKLTKSFSAHGVPVILVCKKDSILHHEALESDVGNIYPISFKRHLDINIIVGIYRLLAHRNVSNIIFFGTSEIKSIYFSVLFCSRETNVIVRYGTTMSTSKKDFLHNLFYSCVSTHVGISQHITTNIKNIIPISKRAKINCIYPSTIFPKLDAKSCLFDQRKGNKIIIVSRVVEGKGHEDLILATKSIDAIITVVGSGDQSYINALINKIESNDIHKYQFIGSVKYDEVSNKLIENGIFVFPSYGEGLGNSLVEALGMGLVCITYDNTVFREFEDMGFYIHLVENRNVEKLAFKINEVIQDFDIHWRRSQTNINLAREIFSAKNEVSQFMKFLK
ncbi:glycosyltransferase family 4 protein [Aeromonas allosaccharophila]|uniref:glycosyltransferase family 4 protein n=1 Tax=Aeromonas allosaccharophila TaxID=656 RepID=UPI0013D507DB|nr:glycosyltransferase family 4 protein [Aeromonas allosaccharophila]WDO02050.1 glycosyltransferase family 4 protein [Aeromonas allosaccharophila]